MARATRRAVLQSPPPNRPGTGGGARGHRHSSDRSSGRAGEGTGAAAGWGAALVAAPLCGIILNAQLDPDVRCWLARHGALLSRAACEAAAEPVAGARAPVQTPSEAAAEQALRAEVHEQLLSELERVRAERDALDEQRKELQAALAERAKRPATVVQQEVKYEDSWDLKLAVLIAARASERVIQALQQPILGGDDATPSSSLVLGIVSDDGLDLTKEPALAAAVSVDEAQQRLRALLFELHHRTRLEGERLQHAIKAAEETITRQHLVELSEKMSEQEAYVQKLTEAKANEIREEAVKELQARDVKFRQELRFQWGKINEESQKLGLHSIKLKQLHYSLTREDDLQRSKKDMTDFFETAAQESVQQLREVLFKVKQLEGTVVADAEKAARAQLIHLLSLSVQGLVGDLGTHRPLTSHIIALKKLRHADPVVDAVVGSIPASAAKEGVASQEELQERYMAAAHEAVRRLLVPEMGGVVAELIGTVRLRLTQAMGPVLPVNGSLVDGYEPKTVLQRGLYYVRNGQMHKAVEEISNLDGSASHAMSCWVEQAQRRLVVEQASRLLSARVAAISLTMPSP